MSPSPSIIRCHTSNASPSLRPWKAECRMRVSSRLTVWPRPPSAPSAISPIGARGAQVTSIGLSPTKPSSPARLWPMPSAVAALFDAMAPTYDELEPLYEHLYEVLHAIIIGAVCHAPRPAARAPIAGC